MKPLLLVRRIRCGYLEAVVISTPLDDGQVRYGVIFQRRPEAPGDPLQPYFDFGELLTVAKLARVSHEALRVLLAPDPATEIGD